MKTINVVNYTSNLLTSILSLIVGVILFTRPDLVIILISSILGGILVFIGVLKIIYYSYQKGKDNTYPNKGLVWAIIMIIIGCICIFLSSAVEQFVRFLIGGWILFAGVNRFIKATEIKNKKGSKFISIMLVSILLMFIGIYVIFKSNLVISYLGIVLIIYSILEILNYIFVVRDNNEHIYTSNVVEKEDVKIIETIEVKEKKKLKRK